MKRGLVDNNGDPQTEPLTKFRKHEGDFDGSSEHLFHSPGLGDTNIMDNSPINGSPSILDNGRETIYFNNNVENNEIEIENDINVLNGAQLNTENPIFNNQEPYQANTSNPIVEGENDDGNSALDIALGSILTESTEPSTESSTINPIYYQDEEDEYVNLNLNENDPLITLPSIPNDQIEGFNFENGNSLTIDVNTSEIENHGEHSIDLNYHNSNNYTAQEFVNNSENYVEINNNNDNIVNNIQYNNGNGTGVGDDDGLNNDLSFFYDEDPNFENYQYTDNPTIQPSNINVTQFQSSSLDDERLDDGLDDDEDLDELMMINEPASVSLNHEDDDDDDEGSDTNSDEDDEDDEEDNSEDDDEDDESQKRKKQVEKLSYARAPYQHSPYSLKYNNNNSSNNLSHNYRTIGGHSVFNSGTMSTPNLSLYNHNRTNLSPYRPYPNNLPIPSQVNISNMNFDNDALSKLYVKQKTDLPIMETPKGLKIDLLQHQKEALHWMVLF